MIVGLGSIVAAFIYVSRAPAEPAARAPAPAATTAAKPAPSGAVSRETLARNDGQDGRSCYVAVDGTVYLIDNSALWAGGRHIPSNGRATCGRDLTTVIDQSPHGRSKLLLL